MKLPQDILDQLDHANCSICGDPVMTKGRGTHVVCTLAAIDAGHAPPQTFIAGMAREEPSGYTDPPQPAEAFTITTPHGQERHHRDAYGQIGHHRAGPDCTCGPEIEEKR